MPLQKARWQYSIRIFDKSNAVSFDLLEAYIFKRGVHSIMIPWQIATILNSP